MASERRAAKVSIAGRVQGVNFRVWTRNEAKRLGLDGWVRNEIDGSVMALVAGPRQNVEAMIALLHQGPPEAVVSSVTVEDANPGEVAKGFSIRR
jgi:acylphosphatase